jgi:uncharacterized protein (DUF3084 family)
LRIELSQLQENPTSASAAATTLSDDLDHPVESITSMKEKLKKLEYEVISLRQEKASGVSEGVEDGSSSASSSVSLLQAEIEDLKRIKREREEYILGLRKTLAETQNDLQKTNRVMVEQEANSSAALTTKNLELKVAQSSNTIRLLEERLKEHETTINKLEQDKSKLELYARNSLATFRDKFMISLQNLQAEKKASDDRAQYLSDKLEANQETSRREERLMLSAMYELGMKIMDRNLQAQMMTSQPPRTGNENDGAASNSRAMNATTTPMKR